MRPFRPPCIFGTEKPDKGEAVSEIQQIEDEDLFPQPIQDQQAQPSCTEEYEIRFGSFSHDNVVQVEVPSSNQCSTDKTQEDATEFCQDQSQNILVWTRLANGDLNVNLPLPQKLQIIDFQQILIAKTNLAKIAGKDWLQGALQRVNFLLNQEADFSGKKLTLQQVSQVLNELTLNFQYENTKEVVEETLEVIFQCIESKDYQKLGEKIYSASSSLNNSSAECIKYALKAVLEQQCGQATSKNSDSKQYKPDIQFLLQSIQGIRREFQQYKLSYCKQDIYSNYSSLLGICYMFEAFLRKIESGIQSGFANENIEVILQRFLSMFFGLIRGFQLSNEMTNRGRTWKECQMKYLVNVVENPDIAYIQQQQWENACINLTYPWNRGRRYEPGTKNARLKEMARRNMDRDNFHEKIETLLGTTSPQT